MAAVLAAPVVLAQSTYSFNLPDQELADSLRAIGQQTEMNILFEPEAVKGVKSPALRGSFTADDAIRWVLKGTKLQAEHTTATNVVVKIKAANGDPSRASGDDTSINNDGKNSSREFRMAQLDQGKNAGAVPIEKPDGQASRYNAELDEVVVTGSRIPTKASTGPHDVKVYAKEQIDQSGTTTVAEFLSTLPSVSLASTENPYQTSSTATTVQLHGLPVGTTLVLINGRRTEMSANTAANGNFFDLNTIPLGAVERIEIVSEGSSAIYGADAIAGVVNIILRKNLDGFEGDVKYGSARGTEEWDGTVAWGKHWNDADVSIVGSFQTRSPLLGADRPLTASTDYRAYGGTDNRVGYCNPGNVFTLDGSNLPGSNYSYAAVSPTATGNPKQTGFMGAYGALNSCSVDGYVAFIPQTRRGGFLLSGHYDFTDAISVYTEIMYSHLEVIIPGIPNVLYGVPGYQQYTVSASNPYNPFGEAVGVSGLLTGAGTNNTESDTVYVRPLIGLKGRVLDQWQWDVAAWTSADRTRYSSPNTGNSNAIQAALNSTDPNFALNPFIAGPNQGSTSLFQSLTYDPATINEGQSTNVNGYVQGPLFNLPAGPVQVVIGGEYERSKLTYQYGPVELSNHRDRYAIFSEARAPILADFGQLATGDTLAATLAARYDRYSDFGGKFTPQLGAEARPFDSILLRGTYSKAFLAPPLADLYATQSSFQTQVADPARGGQIEPFIETVGGNPDLKAETGQSRTFGFVYSGKELPGFRASVTYWAIDESNSIQSLGPETIVAYPNLFGQYITRANSCAGSPPCPITAVNATYVNYGELKVSGFDYQVGYKIETNFGELSPSLSATQTTHYTAALTPGVPPTDRRSIANDDGNWAPEWKGTVALTWKFGPLTAKWDGRYVGAYQDYDSTNRIGNFWLSDLNLRYQVGQTLASAGKLLGSMYVEFGGVNIFDRQPQFSNYDYGLVGFDATQADLRGRYLYAQIGLKL